MAKEKRDLAGKFESRSALAEWVWAKLKLVFPALAASSPGGGMMAYLAYITEWLNEWGPIAWGFAFVIGALATLIGMAAWAHFSEKKSRKEANAIIADRTYSVNPVDSDFTGQSINLNEFFNHYFEVHDRKTFTKCKIYGPANIFLVDHCIMNRNSIMNCNFALVTRFDLYSAVAFSNTNFIECTFYNVLFLTPLSAKTAVEQGLNCEVKWITLG